MKYNMKQITNGIRREIEEYAEKGCTRNVTRMSCLLVRYVIPEDLLLIVCEVFGKSGWAFISEHQPLKSEFIIKYIDKLDIELMIESNEVIQIDDDLFTELKLRGCI